MRWLYLLLTLPWLGDANAQELPLLDLQVNPENGAVELTLNELPAEFLYIPALQSGAGSNDLGLDRGQLQRTRWIRFERYGNRVLLVEPNLAYRADTENSAERRAVEQAFATSVLAGFDIVEVTNDGGARIDLTPVLISDITRISTLISQMEQGSFQLDVARSAVDTGDIRVFPENALIPVVMTFSGTEPGDFVQDVTPTPDSLTLRVTHQFVALPDDGYRPRAFNPRSGYFELAYRDYAAPLSESMDQRLIYRHRLNKDRPLRYWVDNGTPEPIRSALIEGASWWAEAFAEAGYPGGFVVDVLPENADPLDVRYNTIQWVHRATRGWSYGFNISDPRSGEILKGHVSLGSLRVRQDQLIAEALTAPFGEGGEGNRAAMNMALARLRQLSAHEVGHTLGLIHNFAASSAGDASVMDYPHPNLYLDEKGTVALDRAYATGVSEWDRLAIRYGYSEFGDTAEAAGLQAILDEARNKGIPFIADQDSRVAGSAHPASHLWDNGQDVLQRLGELMAIRATGLAGFGVDTLPDGLPLFEMEQRLVPVYLLHRYQVEAAAKLLGGVYYDYASKGDGYEPRLQPVSADGQRSALTALLALLDSSALVLPENLRYRIPPPPIGYARNRENFSGTTGPSFDHFAPARAGADLVIDELLQPQRLARLAEQHALDENYPDSAEVISALLNSTWFDETAADAYGQAIESIVAWRVLRGLFRLASDPGVNEQVLEDSYAALEELGNRLERPARRGSPRARAALIEIRRFFEQPASTVPASPEAVPPGSPIG